MTVFPKQKANPIQAVGFSLNNLTKNLLIIDID